MDTPIRAAIWISDVDSNNSFSASSVDTSLFNHVYYTSVQPHPETFKLIITKDDRSPKDEDKKLRDFTKSLHQKVKTLLSIGGPNNDKQVFSNMASTQQNRLAFITSTIEVARTYEFDGVDLDWEFPDNEVDMSNLGLLYEEWKNSLKKDAEARKMPCLLLTSAVYYASAVDIDGPLRSYPADAIKKHVDWLNLMCYDYHGPSEKFTSVPAALKDPHSNRNRNTEYGITSWLMASVRPNQLVMGLPLYGRSWKLHDPTKNGIGAPAEGMLGKPSYKDIVASNKANHAIVKYDAPTVSYYSYWGSFWTGYDDAHSVEAKVQYAKSQALAGYFFSALGQDTEHWTLSHQAFGAWN